MRAVAALLSGCSQFRATMIQLTVLLVLVVVLVPAVSQAPERTTKRGYPSLVVAASSNALVVGR